MMTPSAELAVAGGVTAVIAGNLDLYGALAPSKASPSSRRGHFWSGMTMPDPFLSPIIADRPPDRIYSQPGLRPSSVRA